MDRLPASVGKTPRDRPKDWCEVPKPAVAPAVIAAAMCDGLCSMSAALDTLVAAAVHLPIFPFVRLEGLPVPADAGRELLRGNHLVISHSWAASLIQSGSRMRLCDRAKPRGTAGQQPISPGSMPGCGRVPVGSSSAYVPCCRRTICTGALADSGWLRLRRGVKPETGIISSCDGGEMRHIIW